jgi:hypothetical protein
MMTAWRAVAPARLPSLDGEAVATHFSQHMHTALTDARVNGARETIHH